ncbi:hypothetical protein [Leucobacter musarum]|uniref:hypothetical protein n=1 Tax=Leucobacter musarum TaxID=1930747 RepID=UPI0006A7A089|nr:hypothetical protein [Leucobacter musarum]
MALRLFRLRVALLGGSFRGGFGAAFRTFAIFLLLALGAVALAVLPRLLANSSSELDRIDLLVGSIVLAAVFLVPFFENRRALDPRQLAQFPAGSGAIANGLLVSTVLTWPFFLLVIWMTALGVLRPEWNAAGWVAPAALILIAVFALCSVRVVSLISRLIAGERFAGALRTAGSVLLVALLPLAVFAGATLFGAGGIATAEQAGRVLTWTPFGAPFAAIDAAASGDQSAALTLLGVSAAASVVLLAIWFPLVALAVQRIERPLAPGVARSGLGWFERFAARPAQVIAARQLTYWSRDPRYRVALFAIPLAPVLMLVAFAVAGADLRMLALIPLPVVLLLLGWSQHNDVAMDSTAIWEHVASGTRGRADRAGRLAPVLMIGVPTAVIGSSITVTVFGDWRVLPAVVGMNLGVLFAAAAISSVFSVLSPYPATRPGDSPFVQPQWSGSGSGLAQTLSMVLALAFSVPPVWFAVQAIIDVEFFTNIWALGFGIVYGIIVLVLGVVIGGWLFDRSGPELIAVTQVFD